MEEITKYLEEIIKGYGHEFNGHEFNVKEE